GPGQTAADITGGAQGSLCRSAQDHPPRLRARSACGRCAPKCKRRRTPAIDARLCRRAASVIPSAGGSTRLLIDALALPIAAKKRFIRLPSAGDLEVLNQDGKAHGDRRK